MSAIAPVAASSFAPEERPQQLQAKESRRTGRHEPIRSSTTRIATRGAGLGITMAAGVAAGINYLEQDLEISLLAGSVAAGMAGSSSSRPPAAPPAAPESGRALGLLGRVAALRALL